jgi:phage gpG-like protein
MGLTISVSIAGADAIQARMEKLGKDLYDFSDEMTATGKYLADYFSTVPFATLGRNYGEAWPSVTPKTLSSKLRRYPQNAHNTLQASGLMRDSFAFESDRLSATVGNHQDYFKYHQLGTSRMPRRVVMAIDQTNRAQIMRIVSEGVQARINASQ